MYKIMIVEDDASTRDELALLLQNEGYFPVLAVDFAEIAKQAEQEKPDLILLDIGLPGRDGFSWCASLQKNRKTPIIFVTSRNSSMDEIRALSLGGDDYITKPYNIPVLLARIKAVLRRGSTSGADTLERDGLRLNLTKGTVTANEQSQVLSRNEMQILACLMEHAGEIVSRSDLIETLWDNKIYIDDNTLSVNVTRLSTKLAAIGKPDWIKTRRGMGYQV